MGFLDKIGGVASAIVVVSTAVVTVYKAIEDIRDKTAK